MIQFLTAAFFSVLSNCICVLFVKKGLIVLEGNQIIMDVFLHNNILNMLSFIVVFNIQKARGKVRFKIIDTFKGRQNVIQFLLFIFPVIAAVYKTYMLGFVPVTTITISSMIVPFAVWALAIFLLKEKLKTEYIKYGIIASIGFALVNLQKLSGGWSFGFIHYLLFYILLESVGQITMRYYCRKRDNSLQAVFAEIAIFFSYGTVFLMLRHTLSLNLLLNPYVWCVSLCCFTRHILLIKGVRQASSIVALEFCAFAKPIFACVIMFVFSKIFNEINDIPSIAKIIGMIVIGICIVRFNFLEKKAKNDRKAIGRKLYDEKTIESVANINK